MTQTNVSCNTIHSSVITCLNFITIVVASGTAFVTRPSNLGGFSYTLVAVQSVIGQDQDPSVRLRDALPALPETIGNWRDYYQFITTDESLTYYNVRSLVLRTKSTRLTVFHIV
jgi:hypothetical protein